ncbi:lipocalin family protein (plasmid) [Pseudoalteromonas sp. T1lg65]|uniref:lipocalin family protein n=1 Tax=Pseudoalteromonas sp. T1lg65 TaxID=2077101 RepID=UPI003F794493
MTKTIYAFITATLFSCVFLIGCTGVPQGIEPVKNFDLDRYKGTWYELARLDHRFERGMQNVTATYSINQDGSVKVVNKGLVTDEKQWKEAIGKAKFDDSSDVAHLKVSFFGPFYGSYVVFELDKDYQYAYVTSYDKDYLWLLSRTPSVDETVMQEFISKTKALGFKTDELIFVSHEPVN